MRISEQERNLGWFGGISFDVVNISFIRLVLERLELVGSI